MDHMAGINDHETTGMSILSGARREIMSKDLHQQVIAIDGPAAAGKTTVALALADRVGAFFLDTGLLYRAVTFESIRQQIDPAEGDRLGDLVRTLDLAVRPATVYDGRSVDVLIGDQDVTPFLRQPPVERTVSQVSAHATVRQELLPVQRRIAEGATIVMVGRDIGSVVVPDAGVKIYLDASVHERARRRHEELAGRGSDLTLEIVLTDLERRDAADSSRDIAPLQIPEGATVVQTDGLSIDQVVDEIAEIVRRTWAALPDSNPVE